MSIQRLAAEQTALLVVDVQEKLASAMSDRAGLERQVGRLIDAAGVLDLPVLVTEQYPRGLGPTVGPVASRLAAGTLRHEKLKFSACIEPVRTALVAGGVRSVLVCGIEAHVCVLQTCLDMLDEGFTVAVVVDAIDARRSLDRDVAVRRLVQAGVLPVTVESVVLEMVREAGGERFKAVLPLIK